MTQDSLASMLLLAPAEVATDPALQGAHSDIQNNHKLSVLAFNTTMFASTTHLSIRRPSPTTVLFTVSNASPRQTITSQILFYLTCLLRVLIAASTALLLVVKSQCTAKTNDIDVYLAECPSWLPKYSPILVRTATTSKWQHVAPISLVVLFLCFRRFYTGTFKS